MNNKKSTTTTAEKRKAPYAPAGVVWEFLNRIRRVNLPPVIDASLLGDYGIPKGAVYALLSTLKFLRLVEKNGTPTPLLRSLQTTGDEYRSNLRTVVTEAYADLLSKLDPAIDSKVNIMNYFIKNYSAATAERATTLFLDFCKEAGIPAGEEAKREIAKTRGKSTKQKDETRLGKLPVVQPTDDLRRVYAQKLIESDLNITIGPGMDAEAIKAAKEALRERHEAIKEMLEQLEKAD
jgi:hypothetical protein